MKILKLIAAIAVAATPVMAQASTSESIYRALKAKEINITPAGISDSVYYQKSVGGLNCVRYMTSKPVISTTFNCTVAIDNRNDGEIYEALLFQEVDLTPPGLMGSATWEKTAGNLKCTQFSGVYPGAVPEYSCVLR